MKLLAPFLKFSGLLIALMINFMDVANATTYYSYGNFPPNTLAKWHTATNGTGLNPANFTNAADIFIVQSGNTYTMTAAWAISGSLQINSGGTLSTGATNTWTISIGGTTSVTGTLTLSNNAIKTLTGAVTVNSGGILNIPNTAKTVNMGANLTVASGGTLNHNNTYDNATIYLQVDGDLSINGTYSYGAYLPAIWMNGSGTHYINTGTTSLCKLFLRTADYKANGTVTVNQDFYAMWNQVGGSFHTNGQTVNAIWGVVISGGTVYVDGGTLTVGNTVGGILVGRTLTMNGDLQVSSGTLTISGGGIYLGTPSSASPVGTCTQSGGTINIAILDMGQNCTFTQSGGINNVNGSLNINYSSTTYKQTTGSPTLNVAGNLTNNGILNTGTGTDLINIAGNWVNNLTFTTSSTNTVTFNGGSNQTIGGTAATTFNNLIVNPSSGVTVSAISNNISIVNNLTVTSGIFDLATYTCNRTTSGGAFSVASNAALKIAGASGGAGTASNFPKNFTSNTLNANSTVEYNGNIAQSIYASVVYGHLILSTGNIKTADGNLTIAGNLTINSTAYFAGGSFGHNIGGNWYNNVSGSAFMWGTCSIAFNGSTAQIIGGTASTSFYDLIMSNTAGISISSSINVDVYNSLTFSVTGISLTTNDNLTFKSTATNTAWLGDMTGNTITGKATVERYVSARKAWRFLSVPTNSTQTVRQTWQEGAVSSGSNPVPGYGIQLSGAGGTAAGFDVYSSQPSVKNYNSSTDTWVGISATSNPIKASDGYMVFIRGDRTVTSIFMPATQTVLRTKGNLYTGDQTPVAVSSGKFTSIGNPFASALDMRNITKTGVKDFFYLWDPALGGTYGFGAYQTFSNNGSGNYVITPGGGSYASSGTISNYIASGQAFFVQGNVGGGSLTLKEGAKTTGSGVVSVAQGRPLPQLRATLYGINTDNSTYIADGLLINYDNSFSNNVDDMDAIKAANSSENLSVKTAGKLLVIERRQPITDKDTVFLNLTGVSARKYRFEFMADQLSQPGLTAFLEDNYLHTTTALNIDGTTDIDFTVENIAGSYAAGRFQIVFSQLGALPVSFTTLNAYSQGANINVEWKVDNEFHIKQYEVEKSADGNLFTQLSVTAPAANNGHSASYMVTDGHPAAGYNYYRIKSVDDNGKNSYSTIVKVITATSLPREITVYPNPVKNGLINLHFINLPEGMYMIRLLNKAGQVVLQKQIQLGGGSNIQNIPVAKYIAHGIYQLEIIAPDNFSTKLEIVY